MATNTREMSAISNLTIGLGKLLREYRYETGLSQEDLGKKFGSGISGSRIKDFENGTKIGKQGFSLLVIVKLAELKKTDVLTIFKEIVARSGKSKITASTLKFNSIEGVISEKSRKLLLENSRVESPLFGNHVRWAVDMASNLLETPDNFKADLELNILKSMREQSIDSIDMQTHKKRSKELFKFTLDHLEGS